MRQTLIRSRIAPAICAIIFVSACSRDQSSVTAPSEGAMLAGGRASAVVLQTAAYTANNHDNSVSIIDLANNNNVIGSPIFLSSSPWAIAVSSSRAVVTLPDVGKVSLIDVSTNTLLSPPITVGAQPYAVALSTNGSKAYVANAGSGSVSVVDIASASVVATIAVGTAPWGVAVSPDGLRGYTTNQADNNVSTFDLATNTTIGSPITVGSTPFGLAVSPNGKVFVANYFGNSVSVIDAATSSVISTISVGTNPRSVTVTPNGSKVLVTNVGSSSVSIIDGVSLSVIATLPIDGIPFAVRLTPDATKAYVTNLSSTISAIDLQTNSLSGAPIPVGSYPTDIGITIRTIASQTFPEQCTSTRTTVLQMVSEGKMSAGRGNSLISKLNEACKQYDNGKIKQTIAALKTFISDVNTQLKPKDAFAPADAAILIQKANEMIAMLG